MRTIDTQIKTTPKTKDAFNAVIGQMSDGIWENSRLDGYWSFVSIGTDCDTIQINIADKCYNYYDHKNRWRGMSDLQVLKFFANKITQIVRTEMEDNYNYEIEKMFLGDLARVFLIPNERYEEYTYKHESYKNYLADHKFTFNGKFNQEDTDVSHCLNYRSDITFGDTFSIRKELLQTIKSLETLEN